MNPAYHFDSKRCTTPITTTYHPTGRKTLRLFCPNMYCLTDELVVYRVSAKALVWLLTDEQANLSWLMMGNDPICPHCGTSLVA